MAWTDVTIIRSQLIMRGFIKDYIVWIHHGKTVIVNDEDEEEYDDETLESLQHNTKISDGRSDAKSGYSDRQSDAKKL